MKDSLYRKIGVTLAVTLIASTTSLAGSSAQEFIIHQQIVSDTAIDGDSVSKRSIDGQNIGNCVDGSCGSANGSGSFVGDISRDQAGVTAGGGTGGMRRRFGQPDLFYNYYTQGYANSANAQMYLSPLPVPPNVGHTFYTYQPFYPHHMLYAHKDRFHRYYDNGRGMNRTRALYYYPPVKTAVSNFYWNKLRLAR